jgi:hypothetical protein
MKKKKKSNFATLISSPTAQVVKVNNRISHVKHM